MAEVNKDAFYATHGDGYMEMVPPFSSLSLCVWPQLVKADSNVDTDFKLQGFSFLRSKECTLCVCISSTGKAATAKKQLDSGHISLI